MLPHRCSWHSGIPLLSTTLLMLITWMPTSRADSPITSTPFSDAYPDQAIVRKAKARGILDLEIAEYLSSETVAIDVKAAIVNALSWQFKGKQNATLYQYFLGLKYGKLVSDLKLSALQPDETLVLGYLTVMDDYFRPEKALPILKRAQEQNPNSLTVAMMSALAQSQADFDSDWCQVWKNVEEVTQNRQLKQDLRPSAVNIILDYMRLYEKDCPRSTP